MRLTRGGRSPVVSTSSFAEPPPGAAAVRHHGDLGVEGTWLEKLVLPTKQI